MRNSLLKTSNYFGAAFLKGAGIALILKIVGAATALGLQILLARILTLENYGNYVYIMAWVGILSSFVSLGFSTSIIRFIPEYLKRKEYDKLKGVIITSVTITFLTSLVFAFIGTLIVLISSDATDYNMYFWGLTILPVFGLLKLFSRMEKGKKRMAAAHAPLEVFKNIFIALGVGILLLYGTNINIYFILGITAFSILLLVLFHLFNLKKGFPTEVFKVKSKYKLKEWLSISFPLILISASILILNYTDVILLGIFSSKEEVAIYNVALKISTLTTFILAAVTAIAAPTISELYFEDKQKKLQQFARRTAHLVFWPTLIMVLGILLFSNFILGLFGSEFIAGKFLLIILIFGQLVSAIVGPVGYFLNMTGHQRESAKVFGAAAVVNLIFTPLGIYFFDALGAAIVTTCTTILWNIWLFRIVKAKVGVKSSIL